MNRQVPNKTYTIVGDGKIARHFGHYFNLLGISTHRWSRKQSLKQLQQAAAQAEVVLVLISDDAIESFINQHAFLQNKTLVHFSGSLTLDTAIGCHPLMTFSSDLYDLETYIKIPFVGDKGLNFNKLFPHLENPFYSISTKDKTYYHAMCVIAGNFTQTLMRETSQQLSNRLDLPTELLFPYLLQNTKNFIANPEQSATGPLQRGDFTTVRKHLHTLEDNPLENIYQSFLEFHPEYGVDFRLHNSGLKSTPQKHTLQRVK